MIRYRYSQNNEEEVILNYFKDFKGKFLDIGAFDGKTYSNTYQLVLNGWSGDCVEPSSHNFAKLLDLYKDNKDINLYNIALYDKSSLLKFEDTVGGTLSTLDEWCKQKWIGRINQSYHKIFINSCSVTEFFEHAGYDYDFISLDVEGCNLMVFNLIPFDKLNKLKCICVEFDSFANEMSAKMNQLGFKLICQNNENLIFAR